MLAGPKLGSSPTMHCLTCPYMDSCQYLGLACIFRCQRLYLRWDSWMASLTQWTWVWAKFRRWWRAGSLVCFNPWGHKESDMIEQLNNNKFKNVRGKCKTVSEDFKMNQQYFIHSVQFTRSVISNSLQHHGLQHARLPCPSPTPGTCSNSCLSSQWCRPIISASVVPCSCLQSFPASGSFPVSWLFASGGLSIEASTSASVLPKNIQDWLVWTCSPRDSQESSPTLQTTNLFF